MFKVVVYQKTATAKLAGIQTNEPQCSLRLDFIAKVPTKNPVILLNCHDFFQSLEEMIDVARVVPLHKVTEPICNDNLHPAGSRHRTEVKGLLRQLAKDFAMGAAFQWLSCTGLTCPETKRIVQRPQRLARVRLEKQRQWVAHKARQRVA